MNQVKKGTYMNLAGIGNLFEIQEKVQTAQNTFNALPAYIRKQFDNDAAKLVEFANDEKNYDQLVAMGLASPKMPVQQSSDSGSHSPASQASEGSNQSAGSAGAV